LLSLLYAGRAHGLWRQRPSRLRQFRPPDEGWMERRQTHSFFRSRLRRATTLSRGDRDLSRRSTVAISDTDPRSLPRQRNRNLQRLPAPSVKPGGRGPDLPALRFAPQRGTPLLAPSCRIVSGRRPSMSEDGILVL